MLNKSTVTAAEKFTYVTALKAHRHSANVKRDDWDKVNDKLLILGYYTVEFCKENGLPLVFTSIIRPKIKGVSKTDIHAKGRAFDISTKGWRLDQVYKFVKLINDTFTIGAISITDGKEREAVWEDGITAGTGPHLHVQCRP